MGYILTILEMHMIKIPAFCNIIRKATVVGTIENGRFKASSVKLID